MRNITLVAAAVTAVLGTAVAQADQPTIAQVQAAITAGTAAQFWVSGSSAAKNGTKAFVQAQICGNGTTGTLTAFSSAAPVSNPDFNAWACTATGGPNVGVINVIYYRAEGGSVVGVYPIINNTLINQIDLSAANTTCVAGAAGVYNCPIAGTSLGNGPSDSWGPGGVVKHRSDLGISDLEPDAFVGNNSPYAAPPPAGYAPGTFGAAHSQAQLAAMPHQTIFQQTFGIVVNTGLGAGVTALSKSAIANILSGNYADWHSVPAFGAASPGAGVTAASTNIFVCNREVGSGTRTSAAIYFLGDHCSSLATPIAEGGNDNYATSDELVCVNNNGAGNAAPAGSIAIGYASVDNISKVGAGTANPNVKFINVDGVVQSNYTSASGQNDYAFEATEQPNAASGNAQAAGFQGFIVPRLQTITTAPQSAQVNTLPGQPAANLAQLPLQVQGVIFTTDFDRGAGQGNSCLGYGSVN